MECNYYLINPTKNITILVESQFPTEVQPFVAKKLLEIEPTAEQVGFIINESSDLFDLKVRMCGGEFCGNACMAAASLFKSNNPAFKNKSIKVNMSGCDFPVNVEILNCVNETYTCCVSMPKAENVEFINANIGSSNYCVPVVNYKGISHMILTENVDKSMLENALKSLAEQLKVDALGAMLFNEKELELTPLVYVKEADTLYWENSCASGTAALGEYLLFSERYSDFPLTVKETGGCLELFNIDGIKLKGTCIIEKYNSICI